MDQEQIKKIKNSIVAIGLMDNDSKNHSPHAIFGSGFVVDIRGYIVTATHVFEDAVRKQVELKQQGIKTTPAIIGIIQKEGTHFTIILNPIVKAVKLIVNSQGIKSDLDVTLCKIKEEDPFSSLNVSSSENSKVLDDIFVCGYPLSETSLNFTTTIRDFKISPLLLSGNISAFSPSDNATPKIDVITDVNGVSGLSGSPIIDANTGEVIGIAQYVLSTPVFLFKDQGKRSGTATNGYLCGKVFDIIPNIKESIESMEQNKVPAGKQIAALPKIIWD